MAFTASEELARTRSDASGGFALEAPLVAGRVACVDPAFENLFTQHVRADSASEVLVIVAPHRALEGRVLEGAGLPVEGARVGLALPPGFTARFDAVIDGADDRSWQVASDAHGRFALERVPVVSESRLAAALDGYEPAQLAPPLGPGLGLELVLLRPAQRDGSLVGRVSRQDGTPAAGALVSLGGQAASTAPDGTFQLERGEAHDAAELVAVQRGQLPGRLRATQLTPDGELVWPEWIEITLGGPPLSLAGQVVDEEGRPRAGLHVWIDDPTPLGRVADDLTVQLENTVAPQGSGYDASCDEYFYWMRTDEQGRFSLEGLCQRAYRIGMLDPSSASTATSESFAAGRRDLRLVFPVGEPRRVAGRVRSRGGVYLEGVQVGLHCPLFGGVHHEQGRATTDAEGRFSFDGVAGSELSLWLRGELVVPEIRPVDWLLTAAAAGSEGEVVVDVLCHLKVDCGPQPELADELRVIDADGQPLPLREIGAHGVLTRSSWELVDGRTITLGVPEAAREAVLLEQGVEVRRVPLDLVPGRLEVVRP